MKGKHKQVILEGADSKNYQAADRKSKKFYRRSNWQRKSAKPNGTLLSYCGPIGRVPETEAL
jgi:hypothetical protein